MVKQKGVITLLQTLSKVFKHLRMKHYERELYNHLNDDARIQDEPLQNIKKSMGSLRHVQGNPMFKAEINLEITVTYSNDAAGVIAPAALPAALQTGIPVYLLGLTDFYSGYEALRRVVPISPPWVAGSPFLGAGSAFGIWQLTKFLGGYAIPAAQVGDMGMTFNASVAPFGIGDNYAADVNIHCNNIGYGTFLNSFVSDLIMINMLRLVVPAANINQFVNPLIFAYRTLFGKLESDSIDPRMYQTPGDFQNQIADIPVTFPVDKNLMIGFQMDTFCQLMNIQLFVEKVEPLTLRKY